jgi:SSS family solute:Na+ symporter
VVTRDILPVIWKGARTMSGRTELFVGRLSTFLFIALSMGIALTADSFGGVLGLIILWFGALVGPIAIPMLFGMLPAFRRCGPTAALASWATGLIVFVLVKYVFVGEIKALNPDWTTSITVAGPVLCSLAVFIVIGLVAPWRNAEADALIDALESDETAVAGMPAQRPSASRA